MKPFFLKLRFSWFCRTLPAPALALAAGLIAGCGATAGSASPGNTMVTLVATSTANDQLTQFSVYLDAITLTSKSGEAVSLLPGYEHDEFIHLNGKSEPLLTASVPDDTYTSATATIGPESFTCIGGSSVGFSSSVTSAYGYTPDSHVTVNLPAPITVSGASMVLSLDLLVSHSASWTQSPCFTTLSPGDTFTITPTFNLATASASQSTMSGLDGAIASVDEAGSSFSVTADGGPQPEVLESGATVTSNGPAWQAAITGSTVFQGIPSFSALKPGMFIDMDATLRADGSVLANRVAVYDTIDTNTATLSGSIGPAIAVYNAPRWLTKGYGQVLIVTDTEAAGDFAATYGGWIGAAGFGSESAEFQISGQLPNLRQLPFSPTFTAANAVSGQWVAATFNGTELSDSTPLTTVTLMPQTIDGTVTAVSSGDGLDTYTVSLAAYDLFPQLAEQTDQITVLNDPSTVVVYADSNTQSLNTAPIAVGSVVRFNGFVFNDSGTLRMDCAQINDGVAE
ncbi:MAG: DUF5666 domain-containing protein [Terracidiphilus sp.]